MRELEVFPARLHRRRVHIVLTLRVGGRDEANVLIENADQVIKVFATVSIAGHFQQFGIRSHLPLDFRTGVRQQGVQDGPGGLLVKAMFGGAVAALKASSKNVTPTPWVPPTAFSVAGAHRLPFII